MARRPRPLILSFACCVFAVFALFASPEPVQAHDGEHPHAEQGYAPGTDNITFDLDNDIPVGLNFGGKMNSIDNNFFGPNLRIAECENTAGPCVNVQRGENMAANVAYKWDRNFYGDNPKHGFIRFNPDVNGFPDETFACRTIMGILGSHQWDDEDNVSCLDSTGWWLGEDNARGKDFDALNCAYIIACGREDR